MICDGIFHFKIKLWLFIHSVLLTLIWHNYIWFCNNNKKWKHFQDSRKVEMEIMHDASEMEFSTFYSGHWIDCIYLDFWLCNCNFKTPFFFSLLKLLSTAEMINIKKNLKWICSFWYVMMIKKKNVSCNENRNAKRKATQILHV